MKITRALINGRVLTQNKQLPSAEAVAFDGQRIALVGSSDEIRQACSRETAIFDCGGNTVIPGIIDSHYHLVWGALQRPWLDLSEASNLEEILTKVRMHPPVNGWVVGFHVSYDSLGPSSTLTRQQLDTALLDIPVLLFSTDRHVAWSNTKALSIAGILNGATTSGNGVIVMAADGSAHGELRERPAYDPVLNLVPAFTQEQKVTLVRKGLREAARLGLTSIHNMDGDFEQLAILEQLEAHNELTLRVLFPYRVYPADADKQLTEVIELSKRAPSPFLRTGLVKFLLDGVLEGQSAYLLEDYGNKPGYTGEPNFSYEHFKELALSADRHGLQIACHAIGDGAVRMALDAYEEISKTTPPRARRHRIEHVELLAPSDLCRFAKLGVVAAMQPYHCPGVAPAKDSSDSWSRAVGWERLKNAFLWRSILESGAVVPFGSDWPVVSQNPFLGIARAMQRKTWGDALTSQALSLTQAIWCYTGAGAFAEFQEDCKGRIAPGLLADAIVLDRNLEATDISDIAATRVAATFVGGELVYES